ncbi:sorting nexin-32 isoform X2 [Rhinolophus sinicus]|uniref:sorting nexin-32 isoform X2 n=1 Tax=Rhinolophus sinicus TaxID=89399 RepID=UPI003D7A9B61
MEEHQEAGEESKEVDDFFEPKRTSLLEYHTCIEDTYLRAGRVMHSHKCLADDYFPISSALSSLGRNTGNQPAENSL